MEEKFAPKLSRLHYWKHRLGIFRKPIGILFLAITFLLVITPFTPGSLLTCIIGLELLDLREYVFNKLKQLRK